jgi:hypothetical protein
MSMFESRQQIQSNDWNSEPGVQLSTVGHANIRQATDSAGAGALPGTGNGHTTRAAVLDLAPADAKLDPATKRVLRQTRAVGSEGTGRKVARRTEAIRESLSSLPGPDSLVGADAARDWAACGLLADATLELMQDADMRGAQWRRLFDCWCRLLRLKAERRAELGPLLERAKRGDDPISRLMAGAS